jgi:hypothetical protein
MRNIYEYFQNFIPAKALYKWLNGYWTTLNFNSNADNRKPALRRESKDCLARNQDNVSE